MMPLPKAFHLSQLLWIFCCMVLVLVSSSSIISAASEESIPEGESTRQSSFASIRRNSAAETADIPYVTANYELASSLQQQPAPSFISLLEETTSITASTCVSETLLTQGATCSPHLQQCHPKFICHPEQKKCVPRKNISKLKAKCVYHYECGYGKRCVSSRCELASLHGEACISSEQCFYGKCSPEGFCIDRSLGAVCDTSMHNQCGVDMYCSSSALNAGDASAAPPNTCQKRLLNGEKCLTDRECHHDGYCLNQRCHQLPNTEGQVCVTQCDPLKNLQCLNGKCVVNQHESITNHYKKCPGRRLSNGQCQNDIPCSSQNATICDDLCNCDMCVVSEESHIMEKAFSQMPSYFSESRVCASRECFGWDRRDMSLEELEGWIVNTDGCVYQNCAPAFFRKNSPFCRVADALGGLAQDYILDGHLINSDVALCHDYSNLGFLVVIIIGFCLFICVFFVGSFLVMLMAAKHIRRQELLEAEAEIEQSIQQQQELERRNRASAAGGKGAYTIADISPSQQRRGGGAREQRFHGTSTQPSSITIANLPDEGFMGVLDQNTAHIVEMDEFTLPTVKSHSGLQEGHMMGSYAWDEKQKR